MNCTVEMYGLPEKITPLRSVDIKLPDSPGIEDVIAAVRSKIPSLEGDVFRQGQERLTDYYAMVINGKFYTDFGTIQGETDLSINDGDRIVLLPLSPGG